MRTSKPPSLLPGRDWAVLHTVVSTVVPAAAGLGPSDWDELDMIVGQFLAQRPRPLVRQLRVFLAVLEQSPRLRHAKPLSQLDRAAAEAWLHRLERSPLVLLRKGLWGVRTLALMGYYARPEGAASVGYRANAQGWAAREAVL